MVVTRNVLLESCLRLHNSLQAEQNSLEKIDVQVKALCNKYQQEVVSCYKVSVDKLASLTQDSSLKEQVQQFKQDLKGSIVQLHNQIESLKASCSFREQYKDALVVYVFGKVKTGKSSLGNYIAYGEAEPSQKVQQNVSHQQLLGFDNSQVGSSAHTMGASSARKQVRDFLGRPIFQTVAVNQKTGRLDDAENLGCFKVGVTETTSTIQSFKLPGLMWVDSPGVHSSTFSNEQLAKAYLSHADVVLYTESSDSPGRISDSEEILDILAQGYTPVILLNKSDIVTQDIDEAGRIVRVQIPKAPDVRRAQEQSVLQNIRKIANIYMDDGQVLSKQARSNILNQIKGLQVYSLSVGCASRARDAGDLQSSGMESFLRLLNNTIESDGLRLKRTASLRQYLSFLTQLDRSLGEFKNRIEKLRTINSSNSSNFPQTVLRKLSDAYEQLELSFISEFKEIANSSMDFDSQEDVEKAHFQQKINNKLRNVVNMANDLGQKTLHQIMSDVDSHFDPAVINFSIDPFKNVPNFVVTERQVESNADFQRRQKLTSTGAIVGGLLGLVSGGVLSALVGAGLGGAIGSGGDLNDGPRKVRAGDNFEQIFKYCKYHLTSDFKTVLRKELLTLLAGSSAAFEKVLNDMQSITDKVNTELLKVKLRTEQMLQQINDE